MPFFVVFLFVWGYLRHLINLRLIYSLFPIDIPGIPFPANEFATVGSFTLDWPTQQYKCWISQIITILLLAALQAVNMFWFFLIWRILVRYVWKGVQKDDRSDDEEEEEEEKVEEKEVLLTANGTGMNGRLSGKPSVGLEVNERKGTLRKR